MAYSYSPTYTGASTEADSAAKYGYGTAKNILSNTVSNQQSYPDWYGNQLQGPTNMGYSNFESAPAYQKVGGLMGGDYDRIEQSLKDPIYQQDQDARNRINQVYGANGLYGSSGNSMMSRAMADQSKGTGIALSDAVTKRYGIQMQDQAAQRGENQFQYNSGVDEAQRRQTYGTDKLNWDYTMNQKQSDFANQNLQNKFAYDIDKQNWQNQLDEMRFGRAMSLATGSSPAYSAQISADAQEDAARRAAEAEETASLYGGIGGLLGGLFSSKG